jgi:hypothetical protein
MSTLLLTLVIAFIVMIFAIATLAIGWFLTGKISLRAGACGRDPHKKRDSQGGCGTSSTCSLCEKPSEDPQDK